MSKHTKWQQRTAKYIEEAPILDLIKNLYLGPSGGFDARDEWERKYTLVNVVRRLVDAGIIPHEDAVEDWDIGHYFKRAQPGQ